MTFDLIINDRICVNHPGQREPYNIFKVIEAESGKGATLYSSLLKQEIPLAVGQSFQTHLSGLGFTIMLSRVAWSNASNQAIAVVEFVPDSEHHDLDFKRLLNRERPES